MNYPVWELYSAGGGFLIAFIAVVHVYVAHFAVGGGLFLVLTEMKGLRENSPAVLRYTKQHSKFFLLLTMVFSSVTGVGIWFTISLLSPGATSVLVHNFVFGFAMEWVCFTIEIVAIFLYFYTFDKIDDKAHLIIGWIYAIAALISLVLINGIISFMLTPGDWLETRNFWDGFFNPSFLSSTFFRITIALVLAGIFGFLTAVFIKDKDFREHMIRYCAKWLLFPFIFMVLFAFWYFSVLPESVREMILGKSPELIPIGQIFIIILPILFLSGLFMAIRMPSKVKKPMAFVILFVGLVYMGSFEWIREAGRRPFLIHNYMYSNGVKLDSENHINKKGILETAKWVQHKKVDGKNALAAGKDIFRLQCICCHSVGGIMNDILPLTEKFSVSGIDSQLDGQGKINEYMPKFMGNRKERFALAKYIVEGLHGKKEIPDIIKAQKLPFEIPGFDEQNDEYLLLAFSHSGMRFISDGSSKWELRSPGSDISAQLIHRGETPEIVTQNVEVTYQAESGTDTKGNMQFDEDNQIYTARRIPIKPYTENNTFNPYPLFTIQAKDLETDKILAETKVVTPVSTEMGCKNCHGGKWGVNGVTGISDETLQDVLSVHDKISRTELSKQLKNGEPMQCQSCHSETRSQEKREGLLNMSAAIHGFHANYLTDRGAESCNMCHPSSPSGNTQSFRGVHHEIGLDCTNCHGNLEDHALSLLKAEKNAGKANAEKLMKHLVPVKVDTIKDVQPRHPWVNEPDCLNCHVDFNEPEIDETFNLWSESYEDLYRSRMDDAGIMCQACHGSAHALYPATNIYGKDRDNIQPMQYQGNPYPIAANKNCKVCHTIDMDEEMHHPNSLGMFRNVQ